MWFGGHWPSVSLSQAHPSARSGDGTLKTTFQTLPDGFLMGPAHLEKGWEGGMEKGHLSCCLKLLSASSWNCGWSQPPDSFSTSKSASLCPLPCTSSSGAVPPPRGCLLTRLIGAWIVSNHCPRLGAFSSSLSFPN